jgi:hypothetical protein
MPDTSFVSQWLATHSDRATKNAPEWPYSLQCDVAALARDAVIEERARWEARLERLRAAPQKPVKSFYDLTRSAGLRDALAIMEGKE